ncbi:efflux RND transporter periplasmic adaptor subunit [Rhabdobacter roseus]|uniref:Membrane fusion protein (Multidrug efflux system) n=1 Tax=Rhabdobacter roseus TaxID=1655419 RepID=A0A840TN57_9BACT|nr:efflux RND transporter periplasmic adaptor subunit [Rhabdobacter roseus]MBB5285101.1 membrane fusion protein (multidrug efflux system) [Rhabdobacter roseus]
MRPLLLIAGIIVLLVVGKLFLFPKSDANSPGTAAKPKSNTGSGGGGGAAAIPVNVYLARMETVENLVYASGTVVPNEEVELKAEMAGKLIKLDIREGSRVTKGQLIAKINDRDLRAQLTKLEYNEELAKQIETRQKKLLDIEAISREEYEITANNYRTIGADKELIYSQLERTEIRAPFSGTIGLKNVSEGAYMAPGTSLATLVQTNPIKIDFTIPEKYSQSIRLGNTVKLNLDGDPTNYSARIVAVDPKVDENLRTLRIRALAQNPSGRFVPGMFVKVQIDLTGSGGSIMIPTEAIVPVLKGKKVFVVKNGKAQETMVTTGLRTDQKVQITDGLRAGDSLIVSGIMALKPNSPVKVN